MATDMQSILNGIPGQGSRSTSEMRDRNDELPRAASSKRFDAWLGSAEASRAGTGQDKVNMRHKSVSHARATTHFNSTSGAEKDTHASAPAAHEQTIRGNEGTKEQAAEVSDDDQNDKTADESHAKSKEAAAVPSDMLLAGMFPQSAQAVAQANQPSDRQPNDTEAAAGDVTSTQPAFTAASDSTSQVSAQAASAVQSVPAQGQSAADKPARAGADQAADVSTKEAGMIDAPLSPHLQDQQAYGEIEVDLTDGESPNATLEPNGMKAAAAMAMQAGEPKPSPAAIAPQADVPPALAPAMQPGLSSEGQGTWSSEEFSGEDRQQFGDSRGGVDLSNLNPVQADDSTLRAQFLERLTSVTQQSLPSNDSASGRSDAGTAPILHAAESERLTELRGASPFAQSVTLDLDPLDMGQLRVRVMMTDQTVHAHIRTEHGELGQGLLQQGPSLESSLRMTGLEMGMLRVTVDQQQQGRGDNAWVFQQQQERPAPGPGHPSTPGEEERAARADHGYHNSGHVSFFA